MGVEIQGTRDHLQIFPVEPAINFPIHSVPILKFWFKFRRNLPFKFWIGKEIFNFLPALDCFNLFIDYFFLKKKELVKEQIHLCSEMSILYS